MKEPEVQIVKNGVHHEPPITENVDKKDKESIDKEEKKPPPPTVSICALFRYADGVDKILMAVGTIMSIGNGIAQPASFIIFGQLIQEFIKFGTDINSINIEASMREFAVYYVIIAAAMFVCSFFQAAFWSLSAIRQVHRIRVLFYRSILKQDIGWFDVNESGTLTNRLTDDILKIQSGIGDKVGMTIQAIAMFFGGFAVGFIYSWKLTLVILALSPLLIICGALMGKVMATFTSEEQTAYADAGAVAEEVISSIRTVAALGGEFDEIERYDKKLAFAERAGIKKAASIGGSMGVFHIVIFGCYALAFWYGAKLVADDPEFNGGKLMIVFFCVMIGAAQIGQVSPNFEAVTSARGAAFVVYDICEREPVINCLSNEGDTIESVEGEICFSDVHFHYPSRPEVEVLNGFNLTIKPGTTVALVGESGCGKSTIVKLAQRFYDTTDGTVMLDNHDVKNLNVKNLRNSIGVVSQEPVLFDMTIAENIQFGAVFGTTEEEVIEAAKSANAHDFIIALPKGYDTKVGERGAQMSGGQKQRIAIARALIRDPKILLFDEATSALDTKSEGIVQLALDKVSKGRTTVIIAHRLSTVRNADVIVAVKDGKVAEMGSHQELMDKKGVYYQLVLLQTMVEEVDDEEIEVLSDSEREEFIKTKLKRGMSDLSNISSGVETEKDFTRQISQQLSMRKSKKTFGTSTKEIAKEGEEEEVKVNPAPILRIIKLNKSEWPYLLFGMIFGAIVGAFPVLFAVILSELIEVFTKSPEAIREESVKWALYFLGLGFLDFLGIFFASLLFGIAGEILTRRLRKAAFTAILKQDMSFFDEPNHTTGALTARLATDASAVNGATSSRLNTMTQVIVMGVTAITIGFVFSWQLTLLVLLFAPILLIAGAAHMKVFANFAVEQGKHLIEASSSAQQAIMNIRTVATLGKEQYFVDQFEQLLIKPFKKSTFNSMVFGITFGLSSSIIMLANAATFALGGKLVQDGDLAFDDMFKVVLSTVFGAMIAGQIAAMAPNYVAAKVSAARLFQLLDRVTKIDSFTENGNKLSQIRGDISFSDISFNYPSRPDVKVLDNFTLNITSGQKVALVGSSGCGKSTNISLLERYYDPLSGAVKVDFCDVKELNLRWLRSRIGLVSQEPVLFSRSIRENITYGLDREVSDEEIAEVAAKANIHGFVSNLPKGYGTLVGDKGTLISGGQKQRIAIARALIRNPTVMLLDEATSALDSESEKIVQEALDVAMEGRTSIIIAHRLSTVQNADVIAVIQNGSVCELGTHQELLARKGVYYTLNQAQL